ncbi:hypothetical protein M8494_23550 [Serratia ureilytica]
MAQKLATIEKGVSSSPFRFPETPTCLTSAASRRSKPHLMLDDYLRRRGVRKAVEIVYTYRTISRPCCAPPVLQRPTGEALPAIFAARDIRHQRGLLNTHSNIAYSAEGRNSRLTSDGHAADPRWKRCAHRPERYSNGEGWLPTDRQTLQVCGQQGVYVIGDTVDLPVSKAGGSCHNQAPVIADNIVAVAGATVGAITTARVQAVAQWG